MSASLIKIAETTVSSPTSIVTITGFSSTYDVYKVVLSGISPATTDSDLYMRFTESGSVSADTDYDEASKQLRSDTTFSNLADDNRGFFVLSGSLEDETGKNLNGEIYVFNSQESMATQCTINTVYVADDGTMLGIQGGGSYSQSTVVDGVSFNFEGPTANIDSGTFSVYGLRK